MDVPFEISRFTIEDAREVAASANEPHFHNFEELLVGMEGQLEHFIDFRANLFKAPYISFVTKGKLHRVRPGIADGKCNIWVLRFTTEFLPDSMYRLYSYYHDHADIEMQKGECFNRMATLCEMMYNEMQCTSPKLAIVRDLLRSLFTMIEAEKDKYMVEGESQPGPVNSTFRNFLQILEDNYKRPEGVDFYAEKLFMSGRNLNLICKNILHKSVSEIIEQRKMVEAKNLLIYTDMPVAGIGFELGYSEKAYFSNVFKKKNGITPTRFREDMRKLTS